ncbi:hypothetical protein SAMN02745166_03448 [Prosthecobacter debontii]|uniref:Uncharacterized protein n=1 Tax=Prosthecobacter debontii TaxID=48467 RepID=A0A1T4YJ69_9BACT|nr:hypothetical protein SAMN02745166_03448 [Prosthecobacter debontii]
MRSRCKRLISKLLQQAATGCNAQPYNKSVRAPLALVRIPPTKRPLLKQGNDWAAIKRAYREEPGPSLLPSPFSSQLRRPLKTADKVSALLSPSSDPPIRSKCADPSNQTALAETRQ